jgi:2'-5' RNA ligase
VSEAEDTVRAFIAVELPIEVKDRLSRIEAELSGGKEKLAGVSFLNPETMHLTLKFLGDTPIERTQPLLEALSVIGKETRPFSLSLKQVEVINRRVIWVSLSDSEELLKLAKLIDNAATKLGFKSEKRRFKAHLTLGRIRKPDSYQGLAANLERLEVAPALRFKATEMALFKSTLTRSGAEHKALKRIVFSMET